MKSKLILGLTLVLSGYCHAAIVSSLDGVRQIISTNIDLKSRSYGVGLTNLASGKLFSGTKEVNFSGDRFDNEIPKALQIAEQLPQVKKLDYEPRLLNIPPILFVAVWLHGKSDDIIIPLPPTFGRWNAYQPYSGKQIIKLLKSAAKKKLKEPPGMFD